MNKFRWLPNAISVARLIALIPYGWIFLNHGDRRILLGIALFIILSDWLDGFLARKLHYESKIGEVLDALGDGIFFIASWIFFYLENSYSLFILVLILIPRLALTCSIVVNRLIFGKWNTKHYVGGKVAAVFYFLLIVWLILKLPFQNVALLATIIIGYAGSLWSEFERYQS
ncbi:CDP-alcohol phosphatidyltransferase family protein [Candidatus Peregrinibacteria bacterium]|nr:CDP-alcohol phosphatidyltransferase family protein [Candidatus Peregrinibacteria bacterium]